MRTRTRENKRVTSEIQRDQVMPATIWAAATEREPVQADPKSGTNGVELKVEVASVEPLFCLGLISSVSFPNPDWTIVGRRDFRRV